MADNVTIHIPTALRQQAGDQDTIETAGSTVGEVLGSLANQYPELGKRLYKDDSQLNRFINVYLDDEDIRFLNNLDTELKGGEEIAIVPAIAGG
jgi:molybdopterin converting factor small subunit